MIDPFYLALGAGLAVYAVSGGADFGGGVWALLAFGPRKKEQREAALNAIAPIWEANHVWLIFVIVTLFTVYPLAFAAISVALHIPITLALIGIVLRGSAFIFQAYGLGPVAHGELWRRIFAWSSSLTPLFLGWVLAGLSSGQIRIAGGVVTTGFFAGWTGLFAMLVGAFSLVLFSMLAAVYLAAEASGDLQRDFRRRALTAEIFAAVLAALTLWRAAIEAPDLFAGLIRSAWAIPLQLATATAAILTILSLARGRFGAARILAATQVALVVLGWGAAMDGHLILPDLSAAAAGSRDEVRSALGPALAIGAALLAPSFWLLFRVFKSRKTVS